MKYIIPVGITFIFSIMILTIVIGCFSSDNTVYVTKKESETILQDILIDIAKCESGNRQFNDDGSVLHGKINSQDIGKYQINLYYWGEKALELGYDLYSLKGNTDMALWIYKNYGTSPWNLSISCWKK